MISNEYMKRIGLSDDQIALLTAELGKESTYRRLMVKAGIMPSVIEAIMKSVDLTNEDLSNEALITEKLKAEWSDMIPKSKAQNVQIWASKK